MSDTNHTVTWKWLSATLVVIVLAIIGGWAGSLQNKVDRIGTVESRVSLLEQRFSFIDQRLSEIVENQKAFVTLLERSRKREP